MTDKTIQKGFIFAGLSNIIGVLLFTKCFTNTLITGIQPNVMSNFGFLMIMVWGLAYIAVSKNYKHVKWLILTFAIEKICYVIAWLYWNINYNVSAFLDQDMLSGIFFSIYGINDFIFFVFFLYVFTKLVKQ